MSRSPAARARSSACGSSRADAAPTSVIETTGILASVATSVHMARSGGRLLLFGIITAKEGALPFYDLYFKELALISARVAKSEDYPAAIALVESGQVRLAAARQRRHAAGRRQGRDWHAGRRNRRANEDHPGPPVRQAPPWQTSTATTAQG